MELRKRISTGDIGEAYRYDEPEECPICQHAIAPTELYLNSYKDNQNNYHLVGLYLCKHCYQAFVAHYNAELYVSEFRTELSYIAPKQYRKEGFDPAIESLSPQFTKIYNQANAAEIAGLDEIAGLGYRKAMEFLVKDFCIHKHPEESERIKSIPLSQCIKTYVDNPEIQTLAERSAWIGNDEAHYIRKQEGRDVSDMKSFIRAMVYFVGMVLITEDAASMAPA